MVMNPRLMMLETVARIRAGVPGDGRRIGAYPGGGTPATYFLIHDGRPMQRYSV